MTKNNPNNERIKRKYFIYLRNARQQSVQAVDGAASALARFENQTKHRDFKLFRSELAIAFKKHLAEQVSQMSGEKLSKATMYATLMSLKSFFQWLSRETGYKSRVHYSEADFFNMSAKDARVATTRRAKAFPTLEQVNRVISMMPDNTAIERRNRALIAFTLLTGARDGAIASMKLKHIDLAENKVYQDARDVNTKFSKTFFTFFFPVGEDILQAVVRWVTYLKEELFWGNDDPLFPATLMILNAKHQFEAGGLMREHWSTASPIRKIFRDAFVSAGLPYFNPHCFRDTLSQHAQIACPNIEAYKAWSQNLGHDGVLTTLTSYGQVATARQGEIMQEMAKPRDTMQQGVNELAKAIAHELRAISL